MVNKTAKTFSIYGHINKKRRARRHPFDVQDSPTPSPQPEQHATGIFADGLSNEVTPASSQTRMQEPSPRPAQTVHREATLRHNIKTEGDSLFMPATGESQIAMASAAPSPDTCLKVNKAAKEAIRKVRQKKRKKLRSSSVSTEEAVEVPPAEEIDLGSHTIGVTTAALFRKEPNPNTESSLQDESGSRDPAEVESPPTTIVKPSREVVGVEHKTFFMLTRRSLRGRPFVCGHQTRAGRHIVPTSDYFDCCDEDELFVENYDSDATFIPVNRAQKKRTRVPRADTPHEVRPDSETMSFSSTELEDTRTSTRTRSKAPSPSNSAKHGKPATPAPQSDAQTQKLIVNWTSQLLKNNAELAKKLETSYHNINELKAVISSKDQDISRLETRLRDLKQKADKDNTNEVQISSLRKEVASLRAQVATAYAQAEEHRQRCVDQSSRVTLMPEAQRTEREKFNKEIESLQQEVNALKHRSLAPSPTPPSELTPRLHDSPLRRALSGCNSLTQSNITSTLSLQAVNPRNPTIEAGRYKDLLESAKLVVQNASGMVGDRFGDVGQALKKLKEVVDKDVKIED